MSFKIQQSWLKNGINNITLKFYSCLHFDNLNNFKRLETPKGFTWVINTFVVKSLGPMYKLFSTCGLTKKCHVFVIMQKVLFIFK